jgi:tetratricopeptide (TPR) repeat protein
MNEALQRWREDFVRQPDTAFDRLVRGVVPLGAAGQLSSGEILDGLFDAGDAALDAAAANWLGKRILGTVPDGSTLHRWVSVLEEYFRGIAAMELPKTGEILRCQHKRLRLWLHGFYEGPDRDPEGAYLLALVRAQDDQRFSPLWRRLILGEELAGRPYLGIGILGFRKMPGQNGRESSDVPEGLLQALVELADKPGTGQAKWKQTMRSLFATYRRSESYWVEHLSPLLPDDHDKSNARDWLMALLPRIREWRPQPPALSQVSLRRARQVPVQVSRDWAQRVRQNPDLCDAPEFSEFLDQHRAYAEKTGDPEYINKTFNNLSTAIIRADNRRAAFAVSLMEEALDWAPWNPHNWTSYAIVLSAAHRQGDAINALWEARHRFAWDPFIRNELGRMLRETGDLMASEGVLREGVSHFPSNVVCRTGLAETLRGMERFDDAREVYEQACVDFPKNVICRDGLADLLIDLGDVDEAERIYREALEIDERNQYTRGGLARALSIRSARNRDVELRDEAKRILQKLADEGNQDARSRLQNFDDQWKRAATDPAVTFRRETGDRQPQARRAQHGRSITEMSVAERLGRAMITLWQAERAEDMTLRSSLCAQATALLEVPEGKIDDDLLAAFVETRGLVLLASGDAPRALAYFKEQIRHYGRGGWIGVRLGEQRARILLGEPGQADDTAEPPSSQSARFALYVARVIQTLSASPQESEVRELLKTLYPQAAKFTARAQPDAQGGLSIESGAEMLGAFLQTRWFRPAGIQSADDLDRPDALHAVIERINTTRTDTFDVISNSTLALAA